MARDGRGGLGLGDRLILLLAWITTCGLVYLLGFYVGKGTQARSLRVEQQVVRLPVTSAPPPAGRLPPAALAAGGFTVLANPTRSREEADGLAKQLRGRGYDATLVRVVRDGDTWYRVQVGRFTTAEQAEETMHRLREHEGVEHAFVASE